MKGLSELAPIATYAGSLTLVGARYRAGGWVIWAGAGPFSKDRPSSARAIYWHRTAFTQVADLDRHRKIEYSTIVDGELGSRRNRSIAMSSRTSPSSSLKVLSK